MWFGGNAHAFGGHVAEGAGVGKTGHSLFAEGVGDEGSGMAPEAGSFRWGRRVVVGGQGDGETVRGAGKEDTGVAAVGGEESRWGGRVPEWSWGGSRDQGDGRGGAALERGAGFRGR